MEQFNEKLWEEALKITGPLRRPYKTNTQKQDLKNLKQEQSKKQPNN